jgi:hypothetical protein
MGKDVVASDGVIGAPARTAGVGEGETVGDGVGVAGELLPQAAKTPAAETATIAIVSFDPELCVRIVPPSL